VIALHCDVIPVARRASSADRPIPSRGISRMAGSKIKGDGDSNMGTVGSALTKEMPGAFERERDAGTILYLEEIGVSVVRPS